MTWNGKPRGNTGKGSKWRSGHDFNKISDNMEKIQGTRVKKCVDCKFFKGIDILENVVCSEGVIKKGLDKCEKFGEV